MTVVAGRRCRRCRKSAWTYHPTPGASFTPVLPEVVCGCARPAATSWSCDCGTRGTEGHALNALFAYVAHLRSCRRSTAAAVAS